LTFKVNGYGRSLDQYFAIIRCRFRAGLKFSTPAAVRACSLFALLRSIRFPVSITALDLSSTSVAAARKSLYYSSGRKRDVTFTQGNLLCLPFADESLDLVVTAGALEYVPLS
jgi:chemotaxis methyl-accepting protein methylase